MNKNYKSISQIKNIKWIILICSFLFLPFISKATHIVGGALTYVYNGGTNYTVSLILYRDCAGTAYPGTAVVNITQADGTAYTTLTLNPGLATNVPYTLDTCAQAPNPIPCVQKRTYTASINLPNNTTGYHLYYQLCCRNTSLSNITTTAQTNPGDGESFYAFIPGTSSWLEDFTLANGLTSDAGSTAWTRTITGNAATLGRIQTNIFEAVGGNNTTGAAIVTWTSQTINISALTSGVNLSADLNKGGTLETGDSIKVYYSLNSGPLTLFTTNGQHDGNNGFPYTASVNNLVGNTIQIVARLIFNNTSPNTEFIRLDNVNVFNTVSNSDPTYNQFPPLFLCQGKPFTFDHSATDIDGDSLYYSFYTPYRDLAPTFPGNIATFTPFPWNVGYSASSPLNAGGPALTLNPSTGLLTGTPNALGQFQVGIKTTEYRKGVKLSDMLRDFQFNIINCPPPAQSYITAYGVTNGTLSVCSGSSITFPNNSDITATNWTWNFGDLTTLLDVSTLQYPSYTYPGPGSYTARMIINAGSACADTSYAVVTVSVPPAAPTSLGTTICQGNTTTLTATAPGGTYAWYDAASGGTLLFTGASYTTPALAATTIYYVQTTVAGCAGPRTAVAVTVTPTPAAPTAPGATICQGTTTTLTASAPGGTYAWYNAASGGTLLVTAASYTTPALAITTTYYVQTTISGCVGPRTAVTVTVTPTPAAPTALGSTICQGTTATLTATAPGGTYDWYDAASGGTLLSTGASYTTPALAVSTTYYVQATISGCAGPRTSVTVTVTPTPAAPTATGAGVCTGTTATLTATAPGGTYEWYDAASGGTLLATAASYTTPVLAANTTYYVQTTISGCVGPRTSVLVTVSPAPAAPTASGTTICTGSTATLTATAPGGTYAWYDAASGGTLLVTAASYTTPVLVANTTYYVQTSVAGCAGPRTAVTVTVSAIPAGPTASGTTICTGTTATLTATAPGGTYAWYDAASGGTLLITAASYTTPVLAATTTYFVQTTVAGCAGPRTAVTVTVSPIPAAPTAVGTTICQGTTATLTATAPGGTYAWYDAASGGTLLITAASYTTPALAATTTYYVQTTVAGCAGSRTAVIVTVTPTPASPTALGTTICQGTTATLTATAPGGTYAWYDAASGGTLLVTAASYTTPALATTTTYYVQTTVASCAGPRTAVIATVTPTPAAPTALGTTICQGTTATLTATAPGGAYAWYDAATAGTLLVTNASYTTPALAATTTYYVQTTVSGCAGPRTAVIVTVTPTPAAPTASGITICQGTTATLTATAPGGTYAWYNAASGGTLLITAASYTTPALAATTIYYVQTTVSGCVGPRTAVTVTVTPTPAAPAALGTTICQGTTATLTATAPGGTYDWYDAASGGTLLSTGASYTTAALAATTVYYVQTTVSGCAGPRTTVTVTVTPTPAAPTASGTTICQGTTATLTATAPGGTYAWYDAASGGTLLITAASYTTPALAATTTYYVQTTVSGCAGPRTAVTVTVTPTPAAPTASGTTICQGTTATLTATAPGGTYAWYNAASGGTLLVTAASYTTPALAVTTIYYVQTTISGCVGPRTAVTVTVTPTPAAPTALGTAICQGFTATLTATAPGGTYEWYNAASGGTLLVTAASYITPALAATTIYYVQTTVSGCVGPRTAVTVTVNPIPVMTNAITATICSGATVNIPLTSTLASNYTWIATDNGNTSGESTAIQNTSTLNNTITSNTTSVETVTYTVTPTSTVGTCVGAGQTVTVTVNPTPSMTSANTATICSAGTVSIPLTSSVASSYTWIAANNASTTGESITLQSTATLSNTITNNTFVVQSVIYTVTPTSTLGSCIGTPQTATVTVNPKPATPVATSNSPICLAGTINLSTPLVAGATYSWTGPSSFTSSSQTPSIAGAAAANAGVYSVNISVNGCVSSNGTTTVIVNPPPSAPVASSNSPVCTSQSLSLTVGAITAATYSWTGPNGFSSTLQNPTIAGVSLAAAGTYSIIATVPGCGPSSTGTVTVTVNPTPTAPTAGSNSAICVGATLNLTATNIAGASYSWTGPNAFTNSTQNPSLATVSSAAAGTYSVTATIIATGCTSLAGTVPVIVNPIPLSPTAGSNTPICEGSALNLTASVVAGASYSWTGPNSYSSLVQNPTIAGTTTAATGTYSVTATVSGCTSPGATTDVVVNPIPAAPTSLGTTICTGTAATLTATAPGGTYQWYSAASGGVLLATAVSYTTPNLVASTTYYVQTTVSGCTSPRTAVTVTVSPVPAAPTAAGTTICQGATATVVATAPGGTYDWYDAPTGGTLLLTGASYTTPALAATTIYYVQTTIAGCAGPRTVVTVTVTPTPVAPTVTNPTICEGYSATLSATAPGGTYEWYDAASGGTLLVTSASYTTPVLIATTTYYVQSTISGCVGPRTAVTVTVTPTPAAPTSTGTTICQGFTATLTATAPGGTYAWYDAATGGTLLITNASYTTPALAATTTYYVQTTVAGCVGPRTAVIVTVNPTPALPTAAGSTICAGNSTTLTATAPGGTYDWYDAASGGSLLVFAASYTTPVLAATTTYYVQSTIAGCVGPRVPVIVTVNPIPAIPTAANVTICDGSTATITATAPGGTYEWYDAASGGTLLASTASYTTPALNATTTYYVQSTIAGCTGARKTVTVTVNPIPVAPTSAGTTICQGINATLSATAPGGTYKWYPLPAGGALLFTGANYTTPVLNATTTYYVQTTVGGCTSPRTGVTVTVNPTPAAPTALGTTICDGNSTTLTATAPGGTYDWYDAATAGTLLLSNASYTTPVLSTTTTYYVQSTIAGCPGPRTAVTVTVTPIDDPSFSYSSGTYCITGVNPTPTITGGAAGTFSSSPAGLVFNNTSTGQINLSASALNTYSVTFSTNGSCPSTSTVNLTVTNAPSATFTYSTPYCQSDANSLPTFAVGASAGVFSAATAGLTFVNSSTGEVDLSATTPGTYTITNTIASAGGCAAATASSSITINTAPIVNAGMDQTICESTTIAMTGTIGGSATSSTWSGGTGSFSIASSLTAVYTPGAGETTATLVLTTNDPAGPCASISDTVIITITPTPAAPTSIGTTICQGFTATLTATAPGGTYAWYDAATAGTLLVTNASYTTPALAATTIYYVQTTLAGCVGPRTAVTANVNPTPAMPTVAGSTICAGNSTTLTATAPGGTYDWYDAASGGSLLVFAASYTTPVLAATTTYYVQSTIAGCVGPRVPVIVTVNPIPAIPTAANVTICDGSTATITATAPGGTYEWYDAASGGTLLASTASYTTPALNATTTYYVQSTIAGCTGARKTVTVTVNPIPVAPTSAGTTICQGINATLSATAPGGTYKWYPLPAGGALLFTGANYTTPVLNATTTYYVQTTVGGCTSPRTGVTVTVNPTPAAPTALGTTICDGNSTTLTATSPGGTYDWYDAATAGTLLVTNANYTTPVLSATTTYYVQSTIAGCPGPRTAVTVTVTPIDDPSFSYTSGTYCFSGSNPTPTITGTAGGTFSSSPVGLVFLSTTTGEINLGASTLNTYAITYTTSGSCPSNSNVNVTVTNAPSAAFTYSTPYCKNGSNPIPTFGIGASAGVFSSVPVGLTFVNTTTGEVDLTLSTAGTYTITNDIAAAGGCAAATASSILTIDPYATVNAGPNQMICGNGTITLAGSIGGSSSSATWSGGTGSFSNISSLNAIYTPGIGETSASLILTSNDPAGPCSAVSDTMIITINTIPVAPTAADATICQGTTATLTATAPGGTYQWYNSVSGGTLLVTAASYTTPALAATTIFYLQTTISGCASPRTAVTVTVTPIDNPSFNYSSGTYCISGVNPTPTLTGGSSGTFTSSPAGLVFISATTGEINLSASALNTYAVTFITNGTCPSSDTVNLTITNAPDATFSYAGPYCPSGLDPLPTFSIGASAGVFSASTVGLNFINSASGQIDLSTSTPGTYTVTNNIAASGGCAASTFSTSVTIDVAPTVNAGMDQTACIGNTVTLAGVIGGSASSGTWTGGTGSFSSNTNLSAVYTPTPGETSATLTLTTNDPAGSCGSVADNMTITFQSDTSSFNYPTLTYCISGTNPIPVINGGYTGTFSATPSGLVFVSTGTGEINLSSSTLNTYAITFVSNGTCPNSSSVNLTITNGMDATFSYSGPYCQSGINPIPTFGVGTNAGIFSSTPVGLNFINTSTGEINLTNTLPGTYTITNLIAASGGCAAATSSTSVTIDPTAIVNAGVNRSVCVGSTVTLAGTMGGGATTTTWSGGLGSFSNVNSLTAIYTPAIGETSVLLTLTSNDPAGPCGSTSDNMTITINSIPVAPTVSDTTICSGDTVMISATAPGGTYQWYDAASGGTLLVTNASYTTPVLFSSATYYVQTTVSGCTGPQTPVTVTVTPPAIVTAGTDQTVCGNNATVALSGNVTNASGGIWTSSGTGTFSPNDSTLTATYIPSAADIDSASVHLILTSYGNCVAVADTMLLTFSPSPIVNAGVNQFICTGTNSVSLNGIVSGGSTTGQWTTLGTGTFAVNDTMLNATYTLSAVDTTAGSVTLILTSTNNGTCLSVSDTIQVTITTIPVTYAGLDSTVCGNDPNIQLAGTVTGGSGLGYWTTNGTGIFTPSDSVLNPVYSPSAADISGGGVYLILTPLNSCLPLSDSLTLTITPPTIVNAGTDTTVCSSVTNILLNGIVSGGTITGTWTTSGDGSFSPSATLLNTTYTFGSADTASGSVMLILSSTNNGLCNAIIDTMLITISNTTVAFAGNDITVCANNSTVSLNGTLTGGTTAQWASSGTGTFNPSNTVLNATYLPSAADISAGNIVLSLSPLNSCTPLTDSLLVTISPAPIVNAGNDNVVCGGIAGIILSGTIDTVASGAIWTSNGTGTFSPNDSTLTATYTPNATDNDTLMFVLTSYGNGLCNAVSDTMMIFRNILPTPAFTATNLCVGQAVTFTDNSNANGGAINSWSWNFDSGGNTSILQNPTFTYPASGTYNVSLLVSSGSGCSDSITQIIRVNPAPVVSYTFIANCQNTPVVFTDASTISSGNITSWNWNFSDGNSSSTQNPSNLFDSAGVYNVVLIVTSDSGCTATSTQAVTINPLPVAGFTSLIDCKSLAVIFTDTSAVSSGSVSSYSWTFGDGGISSTQNPTYPYNTTGNYTVTLIVQTNNGCIDTSTTTVIPGSPIVADYTPQGGNYNVNQSINFINQSIGGTSYIWNFDDGSVNSNQSDPAHGFSLPGTYSVILIASNSLGCSDSVGYDFVITSTGTAAPTGFTPNNDGQNDFFYIIGSFTAYDLRVFNEWGNQIFISSDQSNKWDGKYKGKEQPAGTYIYIFNGKVIDGNELKMNGEVNLIR